MTILQNVYSDLIADIIYQTSFSHLGTNFDDPLKDSTAEFLLHRLLTPLILLIAAECCCGRIQAIEMRISNDYSRAMSTLRYGLVRFEFDESIRKVLSTLHPNYKFAFPNKKSIFRSKFQNKFHISINNIHFLWFIFSKIPKKLCQILK